MLQVLSDASQSSQYNFDDLDYSLDHMGFSKIEKQMIYEVLAAILHLCNLEFNDDPAQILTTAPLINAANLLKLDANELYEALTNQTFKTRTDVISYVIWKSYISSNLFISNLYLLSEYH